MPSLPMVPRRRQRSEDNNDYEASSPAPPSQTSNTSKRARLEPQIKTEEEDEFESSTEESDDQEEDEDSGSGSDEDGTTEKEPSTQRELPSLVGMNSGQNGHSNNAQSESEVDGYKPGSIVRIKVNDFVTYTSAEFFPGPKLNMVIGPNGTGKSTLVCAICLGLGWGPQHLGRAKDPGEFVKHGCREASIEIELAGKPRFRQNPVIRRVIKRDGNKSLFFLNDQPSTRSKVYELAQSFSIQIDNLCQFLPQDKVSEFAALTPVELLRSTQRAAAGPEMIEWHESLKKLRAQQKKLQSDNQGDRDVLTNLKNRQEMQRADVERMRQRSKIKRQIEMLETARPVTRYKDHHTQLNVLKEKKEALKREFNQLEAELEPALRAVTAKEDYFVQLNHAIEQQKQTLRQAENSANESAKNVGQYDDSIKDLDRQIEAERKTAGTHKQEVGKIQQTINKLKRQLNDEPVEFDVDWYNERIRQKRLEAREIKDRAGKLQEERAPLNGALSEKQELVKQTEEQLRRLDSHSGRQETVLQGISSDTFKAYKWLLENQNRFEKEVFAPPAVSCSVKDPAYADAIESLMQKNDFIAFTTQTRNDFKTLQGALNIELRLSEISIRTCSAPLERFQPPLPSEEIQQFGFDGWAKDFLNGPEPVLAVLCSENRFNQTPVGLRDITDDEYNRIAQGTITSWVSGTNAYQITRRREYGPSATSTRARQVKPARIWTSQPVEASKKQEVGENLEILQQECQELRNKLDSIRARVTQLSQEHEEVQRERDDLDRDKSEKQSALTTYRALPEKINQQETRLHSMEAQSENIKARVRGIRDQQDQLSIRKAEAAIEYANIVENLRDVNEKHIIARVRHIEALSDVETLKERSSEHRERLQQKDSEVKEAHAAASEANEKAKQLMREARKVVTLSRSQPDLEELLKTIVDHTMERLEADIDSEKARLELTQGGSSNVVKEFEEREKQIDKLQHKLAGFDEQLAEFDYAIREIRGKWEPKLEALVKSISDAFSDSFARIGCAGQVALDRAEEGSDEQGGTDATSGSSDFDQWSIQIHVKFRENESLSQLDSHRQSGGERAVSTIFYLMALQSLSASPFRVVDEINQGMDPRNERMVHERLVDIACAHSTTATTNDSDNRVGGSGGGQYFLITPKLLTGLVYKPGMRILCIVSGEHMPQDYSRLDFGHAVQRLRAVTEKSSRSKGKGRAIPTPPVFAATAAARS